MEKAKRKICLITTWYPTKKNPYKGVFFKDQAIALAEDFDFTVVHYRERKKDPILVYAIRSLFGKTYTVQKVNEECNTIEYDVNAYFPGYLIFKNKIYDFYQKYIKHISVVGVGEYVSKDYQNRKRKVLAKIFQTHFADDVDVLYCVNAQAESFTLQCVAEALNKPYVVAEHAPFPWPGDWLRDVQKKAIEQADLFMAISYDKIRQVLLQNVKPKKIGYVGNLVDESKFVLADACNEKKTFLIVAAHSFYKNYDLFIEVFNRLTEITTLPFKVMIVGYGSNKGYSKNVNELEEKIQNSKFAEYAEMIPEVSHDKIQEVYGRADAFVMTSIQEGLPVSALEAGCCGLPIFSTMCGGVEDYVNDEVGRIYKMLDSESFANGLKDYLEDKITFDSQYIREYIAERYGKQAFTNRMATYFNEVIESYETK